MKIYVHQHLAEAIGYKTMEKFGIESEYRFSHKKTADIDMKKYSIDSAKELADLIRKNIKARGAKTVLQDLDTWIDLIENRDAKKVPRNVEQFATMLKAYLKDVTGHRVYQKDGDHWYCYYVNGIEYQKATKFTEEHVQVEFLYYEFGSRVSSTTNFFKKDCTGQPPDLSLIAKGYYPENDNFREEYLKTNERYLTEHTQIGKQFMATGTGQNTLDDATEEDRYREIQTFYLGVNGGTRCVVDVYREKEGSKNKDDSEIDTSFWVAEDFSKDRHDLDENDETPVEKNIEIPIHPTMAVFDLKRHIRLRVHINDLADYKYDKSLGQKLVLPGDTHDLVDMLLKHEGGWKDIVSGKGGGAIVLCCGRPGLGKTLTAEVYSEVMGRPLYSVQCSQLGLDQDDLEKNLQIVFARAQRWNAILLLDEADVYVRTRGTDIHQNAIVGVFLRVLEYYQGLLFMTTNHDEIIDDAIISRCLVKIKYGLPSPEDQKAIWEILSKVMGVDLSAATISAIVTKHPKLSGRDIRGLLNLASLIASSKGSKVTVDTITFARKFKPTTED